MLRLDRETVDSCALSFCAGFVDTCVFVGVFGLFTAHVTGNFVLVGAELVHRGSDVLAKLLALPSFVLAVVATVKARDALLRAGYQRIAPLLCVEALLIFLCIGVVARFGHPDSADDGIAILVGVLASAAMGLQNGLMRIELPNLPSTTVMTVNVTQVTIDAVKILQAIGPSAQEQQAHDLARKRFSRMWPPILTFTLGAAGGAAGYAWLGLNALALPGCFCLLLAAHFSRQFRLRSL